MIKLGIRDENDVLELDNVTHVLVCGNKNTNK